DVLIERVRQTAMPQAHPEEVYAVLHGGLLEPAVLAHAEAAHAWRFRDPKVRTELRSRLSHAVRKTIEWDLRLFAEDVLGWPRADIVPLLDTPADPETPAQPAGEAPPADLTKMRIAVTRRDLAGAGTLPRRPGKRLHVALVGLVPLRRLAVARQWADR